MRKKGYRMEGATSPVKLTDLEALDIAGGAQVGAKTLDGLYSYGADERRAASQMLYDKIQSRVIEKAGLVQATLSKAALHAGNQIVNAFITDDVSGIEVEGWRLAKAADAVSPSNILFWDGPDRGGLFGFAEPVAYVSPLQERVRLSRWHKFDKDGTISGFVRRHDGTPVTHAAVHTAGDLIGATDATGRYEITGMPYLVPEGSEYYLTAAIVMDGQLYSGATTVKIAGPTTSADIVLDAPPSRHRRLSVTAVVVAGDDEDLAADESYSNSKTYDPVELNANDPYRVLGNGLEPTYRWGGEVRAEHHVTFSLTPSAGVYVGISGKLFEGTTTGSTDLDYTGTTDRIVVAPGETRDMVYKMWNEDENEPDTFSTLTLTITNDEF
jgi:hypothetical protein